MQDSWLARQGRGFRDCHIPCVACREFAFPRKEHGLWSEARPSEVVRSLTEDLPSLLPYSVERNNIYDKEGSRIREEARESQVRTKNFLRFARSHMR